MKDRFGLGWRPELAASILTSLDRIDVVEVIADDFFKASSRARRALKTLSRQIPVALHGVTMGLASTSPVAERRLQRMASLADEIGADFWSEHLAFVRAGGTEIGHLAAPPRNRATIEGTIANLLAARKVVGSRPTVENIATLIDPPGSTMDEAEWVSSILLESHAGLLLDLHNLHANAVNFGFDANAYLHALPLAQLHAIHLAGGRRVGGGRVLDDHMHDVPDAVYELLEQVATLAPPGLTVILERDGHYPPIAVLLGQLDRARAAVERGRRHRMKEP